MDISINSNKKTCSQAAAQKAAQLLREAIAQNGKASFVVATGASQLDFLASLTNQPDIDWSRTAMYHLDEYLGFKADHPASFRLYLNQRLVDLVHPGKVHFIAGEAADPQAECKRVGQIISREQIDAAFIGIGENGHLAFNDPPADFETDEPFIVVELDEACRRQQYGEGWFNSLDEVPKTAISMSMKQIMKAKAIVCTVPEKRKAQAVKDCFKGEVSPMHPASLLGKHPKVFLFLDEDSASLMD